MKSENSISFPELAESMAELTNRAIVFVLRRLSTSPAEKEFNFHVTMILHQKREDIVAMPIFTQCREIMQSTDEIRNLLGKQVGTTRSMTDVRDDTFCLLGFLRQYILEVQKFDREVFDRRYMAFEDLFTSDTVGYFEICELHNFEYEGDCIEISDQMRIVRQDGSDASKKGRWTNEALFFEQIFRSGFAIQRHFREPKEVRDPSEDSDSVKVEPNPESSGEFDLVISALRILKTCGVYRDNRIESHRYTFEPSGGYYFRHDPRANTVIGEKCSITDEDIPTLGLIYKRLKDSDCGRFSVAARRLSTGASRRSTEDQLIDYVIGLEALFLPDGNQELVTRLSLRVAHLLAGDASKEELFRFMKDMYEIRCKIVHGSDYELRNEDLARVEDLLRRSIYLWIDDSAMFEVDRREPGTGRLIRGKLSTVFFET